MAVSATLQDVLYCRVPDREQQEQLLADAIEDPREYPRRPFVGVGVVVFRQDTVLLIRRGNPPRAGEWSLPGGAQHLGETVRQTAVREVHEETGVKISEPYFLEVIDAIIPDEQGRARYHYTLIDFWAEWRAGELVAADDAQHAEWIPFSRLAEFGLWSKTVEVIQAAWQQRSARAGSGVS